MKTLDGSKPNGTIALNRPAYIPRAPTQQSLLNLDHAGWLNSFSAYMGLDTGVPMTEFRKGVINRLYWASEYIKFVDEQNARLRQQVDAAERRVSALEELTCSRATEALTGGTTHRVGDEEGR